MGADKKADILDDKTKIILDLLANDLHMRAKDVIELSNFAVANDAPLSFRPINSYTPKRLDEGAIGKRPATKAKTAPASAGKYLAGFVPVHPSFGKYGFLENVSNKFLQLHEDNAAKQIENDSLKITEIEAFCKLIDANSKIVQNTYMNGEEEFNLETKSVFISLTIPPVVNTISESPNAEKKFLTTQEFASNLEKLLKNRFHKSRSITDENQRQIFALIDKNQRPVLKDGALFTCHRGHNNKFYSTTNNQVYKLENDQTPIALEIMCYQKFQIKFDDSAKKIIFKIDENGHDITSDYDQLTICKKGKVSDHGNTTPISPDRKSSFGHGSSAWNSTITESLSQNSNLNDVICHNQESSNIYFNPFEDEIHPIFLPGNLNLLGSTQNSFELSILKMEQDQSLITKIENLVKAGEIDHKNYLEKLQDWIATPKGENELVQAFGKLIDLGYFVQIKQQWKDNLDDWKALDAKQKRMTNTPSPSPTLLSPRRTTLFPEDSSFELTDIYNNNKTSAILNRRISRKSTIGTDDSGESSSTILGNRVSRKSTIISEPNSIFTGSNSISSSEYQGQDEDAGWRKFLKPSSNPRKHSGHRNSNNSQLSQDTLRSSISDDYFSFPGPDSSKSTNYDHNNILAQLDSLIEKESNYYRDLHRKKRQKPHILKTIKGDNNAQER